MNLSEAFYTCEQAIEKRYDEREAAAIAHELLHQVTGKDKLARLLEGKRPLTDGEQVRLMALLNRIIDGVPLQYVIGEAWFMGHRFQVNPAVLIPRPETEELVAWVAKDWGGLAGAVLDVGTGSGCIAIALKKLLTDAQIFAIDVSEGALTVAKANSVSVGADITFLLRDFLDPEQVEGLTAFHVIVSNPPYIPASEAERLAAHVRDHEPAQALFVPTDDPLLFYRTLANFGKEHLVAGGAMYCEMHRDYAADVAGVFKRASYETELRCDMQQAPRMLKAWL